MSSVSPTSGRSALAPPPPSTGGGGPRHPPPVRLPVPKRPPLTPSAIFTLIQTIKETGRRLGMSDVAVATACTLFHRMVRVLTVGEETGPFAAVPSAGEADASAAANAAPPATYSATNDNPLPSAVDGSIRSSLGDVDPYVSQGLFISLYHQPLITCHYFLDHGDGLYQFGGKGSRGAPASSRRYRRLL